MQTATRRKPRRTIFSRVEAPLGEIRQRDAGNGQQIRMVKVRMDGPPAGRWKEYARWWWEQNRGPVPQGRRVCHADGDLLNDDPANFVALTPGEVFNLYHRIDPEMSRRNRAACGKSAAARNVEQARIRRETSWLPVQWYGVDIRARVIHCSAQFPPRRKRWMIYDDHGFAALLAERLRAKTAAALAGDGDAAGYVLTQADRLERSWRWMRSSSLGWPHMNLMQACILAALADKDAEHPTMGKRELMRTVTEMRELYAWHPVALTPGVLHSCVSQFRHFPGDWLISFCGALYRIGPQALAARIEGPLIVPVRGRDLGHPRFAWFTRGTGILPVEEP